MIENFIFILGSIIWVAMSFGYIQESVEIILAIIAIQTAYILDYKESELRELIELSEKTHKEKNARFGGTVYRYIRIFLSLILLGLLISGNLYLAGYIVASWIGQFAILIYKIDRYKLLW